MNIRRYPLPVFLLSLLISASPSARAGKPMELRYPPGCIFQAVALKKNLRIDPGIPLPPVYLESRTPLKQFQDAVEPQWGLRPEVFLNAYIADKNEIYLMDDSDYYEKLGRFVDDSLAHELTHYVQVRYEKADLGSGDESLEGDAIGVQSWFRETYMQTGKSPCASD